MSVSFKIAGDPIEYGYQVEDQHTPEKWKVYRARTREINMSNENAKAFLIASGNRKISEELYGQWEVAEIGSALRKMMRLRNSDAKNQLVKLPTTAGNFTNVGRSYEYVIDRLDALINLLKTAQQNKMKVIIS